MAPVKWLQPPDLTENGVDVANIHVQLADDFQCTETGPITDLHLWTSFFHDGTPDGGLTSLVFTLRLYADVPTDQQNPYSHPGDLLWIRTCAPGTYQAARIAASTYEWWHNPGQDYWEYPGDSQVYQFDFIVPEEDTFVQKKGTIYWLGVTYEKSVPDQSVMGWKSSPNHWNDDACWLDGTIWRELRYGGAHPLKGQSMDLAFAVTGIPGEESAWDFGDAPDPRYPMLLGSNGARHRVPSAYWMGGSPPDSEADGQPDPTAMGDDIAGIPDEDGLTTSGLLVRGSNVVLLVTASTTGVLNAWMDFNQDGDWADAGEQIAADVTLNAGLNYLTNTLPANAQLGLTFGRFRFASVAGLSVTGPAPNGEVEDHAFTVWQSRPATDIVITNIVCVTQGVLRLEWTGDTATTYETQFTTNGLTASNLQWITWGPAVTSPPLRQQDTNALDVWRFYRVIAPWVPGP